MYESAQHGEFGRTTEILNPRECKDDDGKQQQRSRVQHYQRIRQVFGLQRETDESKLFC